jgi:hypothetical protein
MSRMSSVVAAVMLGTSCTYQGTPVPVTGETSLLEGEWEGTYSSDQSGRTGSILFQLKAGTDSAYGDVLMIPAQVEELRSPNQPQVPGLVRKPARLLRISFIRCEDGQVTGNLDPYEDPDTRERILTTFEGRLRGNEFNGAFSSFYPGSGHLVSGKWSVKRTKP